jgi:hypothetical protein
MADGILCKHCGWQETEHDNPKFVGEEAAEELKPGKQITLSQCLEKDGFTPENPRLAKKLALKAAKEISEQSGRRRQLGVPSRDEADDY